jgi:hypothetical protein
LRKKILEEREASKGTQVKSKILKEIKVQIRTSKYLKEYLRQTKLHNLKNPVMKVYLKNSGVDQPLQKHIHCLLAVWKAWISNVEVGP